MIVAEERRTTKQPAPFPDLNLRTQAAFLSLVLGAPPTPIPQRQGSGVETPWGRTAESEDQRHDWLDSSLGSSDVTCLQQNKASVRGVVGIDGDVG